MSLNEEFAKNPLAFMRLHVIVVDEDSLFSDPGFLDKRRAQSALEAAEVPPSGKRAWTFQEGFNNVVILRPATAKDRGGFMAHWLPWKEGGTTCYQLDDTASLFFTSQMTGCRLSVQRDANDPSRAKVLHSAGNHATGAFGRQRDENEHFTGNKKTKDARARRFSWSSDNTYSNNSAFVLGYFSKTSGWNFYAQIAKGTTAAGLINIDSNIEIAEANRKILEQ